MRLDILNVFNGESAGPHEAVKVELTEVDDGLLLSIDAPFHGDPAPPLPPGIQPGLWQFEVVELFIASTTSPVCYTEIELGPHGHYLVLKLRGVRNIIASELPLTVTVSHHGPRWRAQATLAHALLPPAPLRVNATAIHGVGSQRRYLSAVSLPGQAPDFHQPDAFVPFPLATPPQRGA